MKTSEMVVTQIPLSIIWNAKGIIDARRRRYLSLEALKSLLQQQNLTDFVVANIGTQLSWVSSGNCFQFWKSEVKPHLVRDPDMDFSTDDFPNGYAYIASEWSGPFQNNVVLLEMYH